MARINTRLHMLSLAMIGMAPLVCPAANSAHTDATCYIAPAAVKAALGDTTLVDVRPRHEFAKVRIPGAANIQMSALASSLLVQAADSVIVIGNGKNTASLLARCAELHAQSLRTVRILGGGLPGWYRAGGTVVGNTAALDQPLLLESRELRGMLQNPDFTIFVVPDGTPPVMSAAKSRIVELESSDTSPGIVLQRVRQASGITATVVILLSDESNVSSWRSAAKSVGLADPLFYQGGAERYAAYLRKQAGITRTASKLNASACVL